MLSSNKNSKQNADIFKPIVIATVIMLSILFFYIPYVTDKSTMESVKAHSISSVKQIKLTREYYVENVVDDIKKYAPQTIKFSYQHKGVDGILPLPTTTIHDLSEIFSKNTGVKYNLYSEFPFKNRESRVLTKFQKEALHYINKNEDGIYTKRDEIDGKPVLRVAVTDFMTQESCVKCHNNHPERTWERGKWKLGDKRGIIEVITPLEKEIEAHELLKYSIMTMILVSTLSVLAYFFFIVIKREKAFVQKIEAKNEEIEYEMEISDSQKSLLEEHKKAIDLSAIVSKTDINGNITYVNDQFCKITGYSREELIGRSHSIVNNPSNPRNEFKKLWAVIKSKKVYKGTIKNISKDGKDYYVDTTIIPILDKDEKIIEFLALSYNVTEHIQALEYAYIDQLTEISNRHKFEELFSQKLKEVKRDNNPFCLAILDIDKFKQVNDTFGHLEGDKVLVMIANSLETTIRETDYIARWGGEEFILLLNNVNLNNAMKVVEKFRNTIEHLELEPVGKVTASFGITEYKENDQLEDMIKRADEALYQAKNDGRNCIRSM